MLRLRFAGRIRSRPLTAWALHRGNRVVVVLVAERQQGWTGVFGNVATGASTQRDELRVAGLALPVGSDALDGLDLLGQGGADEVADEAVEVGVPTARFAFEQVENSIRHLPLDRIERFFAGQALVEVQLSADALGEGLGLHGCSITRVGVAYQSVQGTYRRQDQWRRSPRRRRTGETFLRA